MKKIMNRRLRFNRVYIYVSPKVITEDSDRENKKKQQSNKKLLLEITNSDEK